MAQDSTRRLLKVFGIAVTVIATFEGYDAPATAEGVSGATTELLGDRSFLQQAVDRVLPLVQWPGTVREMAALADLGLPAVLKTRVYVLASRLRKT